MPIFDNVFSILTNDHRDQNDHVRQNVLRSLRVRAYPFNNEAGGKGQGALLHTFSSVISVIMGAENLCSFFAVSDYEPGVFTNDFTRINIF